jgi:diguanylate cyclase (GGDEF)-like protein
MESHRNGRPASDTANSSSPGTAERRLSGPRFIPLYCNATAQQFGTDPDWIAYARSAFIDWADYMADIIDIKAEEWIIADAAGAWMHRFQPGREGLEASEERDGLFLPEWTAEVSEASGPILVKDRKNGMKLVLTGLRTGDGNTALILGWLLKPEIAPAAVGQTLFHAAAGYPPYLYYQLEKAASIRFAEQHQQNEKEARKKELLFQMAHELYSKNDTDEILSEMIRKIHDLYPLVKVSLLMTQDQHTSNLSVKPLRFVKNEEDTCTRAFMEGRMVIEKCGAAEEYEMAVPLSGKQGIYGVLHVHSHHGPFETPVIQMMKVLSDAAGSAFENAKLYEQSNILVNELRLINELTKQLSQSLKVQDIFNFASSELTTIFHADYCCILQLDKEKREFVVQATNVPSMLYESFGDQYGFAGMVSASREPVIVSDYWSNPSSSSKLMHLTGARSLIAAPLIVQNEVQGVILVAHRIPGFFTYDNYKLLQVLASHIGLALANASLHAEVRRMVITDNLTGLFARHFLDEQVGFHQKKDFCGSLIVVDIDHFKSVNDTYGHQVGDQILMQVSRIIKTSIRDSDIAARWGGEELAIYLPQVTTEQAVRIAERIRSRVQQETDPSVTVSCGISEWNWQDEKISVETLFYRSDMALYKAKNEGRNRVEAG